MFLVLKVVCAAVIPATISHARVGLIIVICAMIRNVQNVPTTSVEIVWHLVAAPQTLLRQQDQEPAPVTLEHSEQTIKAHVYLVILTVVHVHLER